MITDAELRALLLDCLRLWERPETVIAEAGGLRVGDCIIRRAQAPLRWVLASAARTRAVPSVVALLSALRSALGVEPGTRART